MAILDDQKIRQIITEITEGSEVTRRAQSAKRHSIYKDGGKEFLIEKIVSEFGSQALKEMRLAPINLLKKIVNKRSSLYQSPAVRDAGNPSDQKLVDFYVEELDFDSMMMKWHRYLNLLSNSVAYVIPNYEGELCLHIVPSYLYSIVSYGNDKTKPDGFVFNAFTENVTPYSDVPSASGEEGFSKEKGIKTSKDLVASQEKDPFSDRQFVFWTDTEHFTTDQTGAIVRLSIDTGPEQFQNPIMPTIPVVNLTKDRDNEIWATQGEDLIDLTMAIQLGWTDVLTIAKHQGFSILTVVSEEPPQQLTIGVNKAVWLKAMEGKTTPSVQFVQSTPPLAEYKELLVELLGLLLSTNDMNPKEIGGSQTSRSYTSGFHALIEMSDTIQAREEDKPKMRAAEQELWQVIKTWHNYLFDNGTLEQEAASLGRFSEDFEVSVSYRDMKPIESEQERLAVIKDELALGLISQSDALKKLHPDWTDKQIEQKLLEIKQERTARQNDAMKMLSSPQDNQGDVKPDGEDQSPV